MLQELFDAVRTAEAEQTRAGDKALWLYRRAMEAEEPDDYYDLYSMYEKALEEAKKLFFKVIDARTAYYQASTHKQFAERSA